MKIIITKFLSALTLCSSMFAYSYHPNFDLDDETISEIIMIEREVNQNGNFLHKINLDQNF